MWRKTAASKNFRVLNVQHPTHKFSRNSHKRYLFQKLRYRCTSTSQENPGVRRNGKVRAFQFNLIITQNQSNFRHYYSFTLLIVSDCVWPLHYFDKKLKIFSKCKSCLSKMYWDSETGYTAGNCNSTQFKGGGGGTPSYKLAFFY